MYWKPTDPCRLKLNTRMAKYITLAVIVDIISDCLMLGILSHIGRDAVRRTEDTRDEADCAVDVRLGDTRQTAGCRRLRQIDHPERQLHQPHSAQRSRRSPVVDPFRVARRMQQLVSASSLPGVAADRPIDHTAVAVGSRLVVLQVGRCRCEGTAGRRCRGIRFGRRHLPRAGSAARTTQRITSASTAAAAAASIPSSSSLPSPISSSP